MSTDIKINDGNEDRAVDSYKQARDAAMEFAEGCIKKSIDISVHNIEPDVGITEMSELESIAVENITSYLQEYAASHGIQIDDDIAMLQRPATEKGKWGSVVSIGRTSLSTALRLLKEGSDDPALAVKKVVAWINKFRSALQERREIYQPVSVPTKTFLDRFKKLFSN